jgi:uncharacterized protein DUF6587
MIRILDDVLVGLVLIVSAAYAASALGPRSLRRRVLGASSRLMARMPASLGLRRMAQWLAVRSAGMAQGACGGCDNCGPEPAPTQKSADAEVGVPLSSISRRRI